jgi:Uri superfamily endonuclease
MSTLSLDQSPSIPSLPGTYALILYLPKTSEIEIGKLGKSIFPPGYYIYVGSALGPGGLAGRLRRHGKSTTSPGWQPKWHIDYLRHYTKTVEFWVVQLPSRREHDWASVLQELPGATITMPGFGSSDCVCPAHLFHFPHHPQPDDFQRLLRPRFPGEEVVVFDNPF